MIGWASLNPYSHRYAYSRVADLSVYIERSIRGQGIGSALLEKLEAAAQDNAFHKIVLFTFPFNDAGQGLYRKMGYREVGVFEKQGVRDGAFIDVKTPLDFHRINLKFIPKAVRRGVFNL
ncbi:hypothetical protein A3842_21725 [Paenibacillus sp. P3E]|nr:hypothetical protein A3842_21725 [Paenibacillus sp. P3E]